MKAWGRDADEEVQIRKESDKGGPFLENLKGCMKEKNFCKLFGMRECTHKFYSSHHIKRKNHLHY